VGFALVGTRLGAAFAFVPIPWTMVIAIAGLVAAYLASEEVAKKFASAADRR
jgi:hypothetical protein